MISIEAINIDLAEKLCRKITADLTEYFGLPEVNAHYADGVRSRINFGAKRAEAYIGLISIDFSYPQNANIYWMGVLRNFHRQGIGSMLASKAFDESKIMRARTISVETLSPDEADPHYKKKYHFYQALGFFLCLI